MRSVFGVIGVALTTVVVTSVVLQTAFVRAPQPIPASPVPIAAAPAVATVTGEPRAPSVRAVAEFARPAVVQINTAQAVLDRLGRPSTGVSSGVVYDPSGLILTNNHMIEGAARLLVSLPDGRVYPGSLVGDDPQMDLAVVRITPDRTDVLPVARLGDVE